MASSVAGGLHLPTAAAPRRRECGGGARPMQRRFMAMAMGDGRRDSLDHLQRIPSKQQQQAPSAAGAGQAPTPASRRAAAVQLSPPLGRWDRFPTARTVQQMMETMERIMEDPFAYSGVTYPSSPAEDGGVAGYRRGRTPWEIKEGKGDYKMRFDMPGMTKNDLKVSVDDNMLVIHAEKAAAAGEAGGEGDQEEAWPPRSYGRYSSRIALPENVVVEKITAEVKDGVLYVTIPKIASSSKVLNIAVQ